ncbi:MAG TPA: hypothetical protein VLW06_14785 [Terriglobales bacterium]|nr:hypothetical protein [Terriglobales bacterium]
MKTFVVIVLLLLGSLQLRALDREAFTFTKYDLNVRVEPQQQRLGVRGKIMLRNDSGSPQRSLSLQISSSLNWSSIRFQGQPVEFLTQPYISDIDHTGALSEAIVVLPQAVAPRQSIELEIGYEGVIAQDATRLTSIGVPADAAKHADWDQISPSFTAIRGAGYVAWYPVAINAASLSDGDAVPDAIAKWKRREAASTFDLKLCTPQNSTVPGLAILMNSTEAKPKTTDPGGNTCREFSFDPLRELVPVFTLGGYLASEHPDIDIHFFVDHQSGADDYSSAIDEVTPLVTKWFGDHRGNPQLKSQLVELSDAKASSFETGNTLLMPLDVSDTKLLLSAAQQVTHLFFPSPRSWILDGLASYAQARLIEEKEGRQAAIAYLEAHRSGLLQSEKDARAIDANGKPLISASDPFRIEAKAMYVWWMLRDLVGENAFDAALHSYNAADDKEPTYFEKLIEAQSHNNLHWFFDDWVYHDGGLPELRIASVYPNHLPSGGYMVTVTVENHGGAGAEIPVTLHMQNDEATDRLLVRAKSRASVRIETPSLPQKATVNDGSVPESDTGNNEYKIQLSSH